MNCIYCNSQLTDKGFYCPTCFKQSKCKHCSEPLLKDIKICVFCGEEIGQKSSSSNLNTIEFSETETERKFKASFTDTVGQSISESFGMILTNKIGMRKILPPSPSLSDSDSQQTDIENTNSEVLHDAQLETAAEVDKKPIPSLKEIKLRDLAKTETDWLLVYTYYASNKGTKEFTRDNIVQLYKDSDRKSDKRINALSQLLRNISKALYIKPTNDTQFILLEKGKTKVHEIFKGNSKSKSVRNSKSKLDSSLKPKTGTRKNPESKMKKAKGASSIGFVDLKLTTHEQKSLKEFFELKKPTSQNENVIVAMKWFIDNKKVDEVSKEEMNYLLSVASKTPSALPQVLGNMVGSGYRWVTKGSLGKYKLSTIGENHILNSLPKGSK